MLTAEEERRLACRWRDDGDVEARDRLVHSHLRLVIRIANEFRGYGRPVDDYISVGGIGLLEAVRRFDPDRGARLSTYAAWWIRSAIRAEVMRSWSLVKIGTTVSEKKLFFGLRRAKGALGLLDDYELSDEAGDALSRLLGVPSAIIVDMNRRLMHSDQSLNLPIDDTTSLDWQDLLVDPGETPEAFHAEQEERVWRHRLMTECLGELNERERRILEARRLREKPVTLKVLGESFGISCERVRQIEARAIAKLADAMRLAATDNAASHAH